MLYYKFILIFFPTVYDQNYTVLLIQYYREYPFSNLIPEDWNNCEMGFFAGIFPVQLQSPPNPYPLPLGLHVPTTKNGFQKDWLSRIEPIVLQVSRHCDPLFANLTESWLRKALNLEFENRPDGYCLIIDAIQSEKSQTLE